MPPIAVPNFKACFAACDKDSRCTAFAFLGGDGPGNCYLKNNIGPTPNMTPSDADAAYIASRGHYTTSSQRSSTSSSNSSNPSGTTSPTNGKSCKAIDNDLEYTDSAGRKYSIECGTDHNGGDLDHKNSDSFSGCFTICDQTPDCVGFAYVGGSGPGVCYLKSSITAAESNPAVDFAKLDGVHHGPNSPPSIANGGCKYLKSDSEECDGYNLKCQTDYVGGDLSQASVGAFVECFSACDAISDCLGFAFVGGNGTGICYFKSEIVEGSRSTTVDSAVRKRNSGGRGHTDSTSRTTSGQHETSKRSSIHSSSTTSFMSHQSTSTSKSPSRTSSHTSPTTTTSRSRTPARRNVHRVITTTWGSMHPSRTTSSHHSTITPPPTAPAYNGANGAFFTALGHDIFANDDPREEIVKYDIADHEKQEYSHFFDVKHGGVTTIAGETFSAFPDGHGVVVDRTNTHMFTYYDSKPSISPSTPSTMRTVLRSSGGGS